MVYANSSSEKRDRLYSKAERMSIITVWIKDWEIIVLGCCRGGSIVLNVTVQGCRDLGSGFLSYSRYTLCIRQGRAGQDRLRCWYRRVTGTSSLTSCDTQMKYAATVQWGLRPEQMMLMADLMLFDSISDDESVLCPLHTWSLQNEYWAF